MLSYVKRPRLGQRKREALVAYLHDEISQQELAVIFGVKRQNVPNVTNGLFRYLVMEGRIDINNLIQGL